MPIKIHINEEAKAEINQRLNSLLEVIGDTLVSHAKAIAPVDTGALRDSIEVKSIDKDEKKVIVGSSVEYAKYQELGTSKMSAQPFLRPSLDSLPNDLGSRV